MRYLILIAFVGAGGPAHAQIQPVRVEPGSPAASQAGLPSGSTGHLSPIPLYFASELSSPALANSFVFLEPDTWNVVVSYPGNVDDPNASSQPASRKELRIELKNHVEPFVFLTFARDPAGSIIYSYSITNRADARQAIQSWGLHIPFRGNLPEGPADAVVLAQGSPAVAAKGLWTVATSTAEMGMVYVSWTAGSGSSRVAVGGGADGFTVTSPLKPGFVEADAEGYSAGPELDQLAVPNRVKEQLQALQAIGFNRAKLLTLGPKFEPDAPKVAIAADFAHGIDVLVRNGYLNAASPFVEEASAALRQYLDAVQFAPDIPASEYTGPPIVITKTAAVGLESQILSGLKIGLDLP